MFGHGAVGRDALSRQSSELSVAKANETDAVGNIEVGRNSLAGSGESCIKVERLWQVSVRARYLVLYISLAPKILQNKIKIFPA